MASSRHTGNGGGRSLWRLLTIAGLLVSAGSLFRTPYEALEARGKHVSSPSAESLECGHEVKDINVRGTVYILAAMAASTALVVGIVFAMVWRFDLNRQADWAGFTPQQTARVVPPAPHLQRDPFLALAREQSREQHLLHSYGWTSADHTYARIPIDRAMKLTVGTSLDQSP